MSADPPLPGLLLAAGGSCRFGAAGDSKLLAPVAGRPAVTWAAEALRAAGIRPLYAVVGHRAGEVAAALPEDVRVLRNPHWVEGQAGSLARGVRALAGGCPPPESGPPESGRPGSGEPGVPAVVVALGDEPGLRPETVGTVVAAWLRERPAAARARYRDRPGHPVVLSRLLFPELAELEGDEGAARLLQRLRRRGRLLEVRIDRPAPADIDTEADHERVRDACGP